MGSLNKIEVMDIIHRMTKKGFLKSNILRSPRQIDIVARLQAEKPDEWKSKNSLKVIVHRKIKELIKEQLVEKKNNRYDLTDKGRNYLLSNKSIIRSNYKHNWDEINIVPGLHASYGINLGYLNINENNEQKVRQKITDFMGELEKITPNDTLDLKININIDGKQIKS